MGGVVASMWARTAEGLQYFPRFGVGAGLGLEKQLVRFPFPGGEHAVEVPGVVLVAYQTRCVNIFKRRGQIVTALAGDGVEHRVRPYVEGLKRDKRAAAEFGGIPMAAGAARQGG